MLFLYVEAPFAAFRTFTAGWYRPTATFLTPSAAYGLLLNVAGIETRLREENPDHDGKVPATLTRPDLPAVEIAVGAPAYRLRGRRQEVVPENERFPRVQTVYQQLHNYPVGKGNKVEDPDKPGEKVYQGDLAARRAKGNKSNITPVRREFLSDLRAVVGVRGDADLLDCVRRGVSGHSVGDRYGVPFLGDNSFLLDRLDLLDEPGPVYWFEQIMEVSGGGPRPRTTRLTIRIDRGDLSQTTSALYAPLSADEGPVHAPPATAWTKIEPPSPPPPSTAVRRPRRGSP